MGGSLKWACVHTARKMTQLFLVLLDSISHQNKPVLWISRKSSEGGRERWREGGREGKGEGKRQKQTDR